MGRISEPVNYSLQRKVIISPYQLQETGCNVSFDAHFNWNIVKPLKLNKTIFIPEKTYVLEEVNFPSLSVDNFISQKGIRPRSIEEIYANAVNFVETWTQPSKPLFLRHKVIVLYLGYTLIGSMRNHAVGILEENRYKIILDTNPRETMRGDFWLI
jgi:hypothetical protein